MGLRVEVLVLVAVLTAGEVALGAGDGLGGVVRAAVVAALVGTVVEDGWSRSGGSSEPEMVGVGWIASSSGPAPRVRK